MAMARLLEISRLLNCTKTTCIRETNHFVRASLRPSLTRHLLQLKCSWIRRSSSLVATCNLDGLRLCLGQLTHDIYAPIQLVGLRSFSGDSYNAVCEETLESLAEFFEEVVLNHIRHSEVDVTLGAGVLTVKLGHKIGTYVINKQTPNEQIWLSSPKSGPKRYDLVSRKWIYKRDGVSLHELLSQELTEIVGTSIDFTQCSYGK